MDDGKRAELEQVALEVRKDIVRMMGVARAHGLSAALTAADVLVYLYWAHLRTSPEGRNRDDRDRVVLSKGLAAAALYACLSRRGYFGRDELWSYRRLGAMLQGYPDLRTPGVDAPGGVAGDGIGVACGICLGLRMQGIAANVYCLAGEEELREGVAWESLETAADCRLGNLVLLLDAPLNADDAGGRLRVLKERLGAWGWRVCEADGHDFAAIEAAFATLGAAEDVPKVLILHTVQDGDEASFRIFDAAADTADPITSDDIDNALTALERRGRPEGRAR